MTKNKVASKSWISLIVPLIERDELFEKARGEILDEVINLSLVSSQTWEDAISKKLWQKVAPFVFENIYLPAAAMTSDTPERPISTYNKTGKNLSILVWNFSN